MRQVTRPSLSKKRGKKWWQRLLQPYHMPASPSILQQITNSITQLADRETEETTSLEGPSFEQIEIYGAKQILGRNDAIRALLRVHNQHVLLGYKAVPAQTDHNHYYQEEEC